MHYLEIARNLSLSVLVSVCLFLVFPVVDYLRGREINMLNTSEKKIKIETKIIEKEKPKPKKIKVIERPLSSPKASSPRPLSSRFALDLSVQGVGEGVAGLASSGAMGYEEGDVDVVAQVVKEVEAEYPPLALRNGVTGAVTLRVLIGENGECEKVEFLRGSEGYSFKESAIRAVSQWKFAPAMLQNVAVKQWAEITVNFGMFE